MFKNLRPNDGDIVRDFEDGCDVLLFKGGNPNFADVSAGVVVRMPNGYEALLQGWDIAALPASVPAIRTTRPSGRPGPCLAVRGCHARTVARPTA